VHDLPWHDALRLVARAEHAGDELALREQLLQAGAVDELRFEREPAAEPHVRERAVLARAADQRQLDLRRRRDRLDERLQAVQRHAGAEEQHAQQAVRRRLPRQRGRVRQRLADGHPGEAFGGQAGQRRDVGRVRGRVEQHEVGGGARARVEPVHQARRERARFREPAILDRRVVGGQEEVEHHRHVALRTDAGDDVVPRVRHDDAARPFVCDRLQEAAVQGLALAPVLQKRPRPAPRLAQQRALRRAGPRHAAVAHLDARGLQPRAQCRGARVTGPVVPGAAEQHVSAHHVPRRSSRARFWKRSAAICSAISPSANSSVAWLNSSTAPFVKRPSLSQV
jgi:hypothetical protein